MLKHDLRRDDGLLLLEPDGPLEKADFQTLTSHVDAYLENNGVLHGVLIRAPKFPGWKDFGALVAHLRFVKQHHQKIEKIAVVADGSVATVMPHIAQHFVHAHIKHFDPAEEDAAWEWLMQRGQARVRTAA
jgi:hypothetical protein